MITREYLITWKDQMVFPWKDQKARKHLYSVDSYGDIRYFCPSLCNLLAEMDGRGPANMPEIVGIQLTGSDDTILLACLFESKKAAENSLRSGSREEKGVPKLKGFPGSPRVDDFMDVIESILIKW